MLKGEGFGPHSEKHGSRLGKQIGAGATGLARRFVTVEEEPVGSVVGLAEVGRRVQAERGKRGPPPGERPWEAMGISRRTYFRRKKGGG